VKPAQIPYKSLPTSLYLGILDNAEDEALSAAAKVTYGVSSVVAAQAVHMYKTLRKIAKETL
jgi:hypothetical protein